MALFDLEDDSFDGLELFFWEVDDEAHANVVQPCGSQVSKERQRGQEAYSQVAGVVCHAKP
jgi:hypothetical protein